MNHAEQSPLRADFLLSTQAELPFAHSRFFGRIARELATINGKLSEAMVKLFDIIKATSFRVAIIEAQKRGGKMKFYSK